MFEQRKKLRQHQNGTKSHDVETDSDMSPDTDRSVKANTNESFYLQRVAKYFDEHSNDKSESNKALYYGMITSSKPVESDNSILLWHVQYDDDSEDFNKQELMDAIKLYRTTSGMKNGVSKM